MTDQDNAPSQSPSPKSSQAKRPLPAAAKVGIGCGAAAIVLIMIVVSSVVGAVNSFNQGVDGATGGRGLACVFPFVLDNGDSVLDGSSCVDRGNQPTISPQDQAESNKGAAFAATLTSAYKSSRLFTSDPMSAVGAWGPIPCAGNIDSCVIVNSKLSNTRDDAGACKEFLSIAGSLGAIDYYDTSNQKHVISPETQSACIAMLGGQSRSVGWGLMSYEFLVTGKTTDGTPFGIELDRTILPDGVPQGAATPSPTSTPWVVNNSLPSSHVQYGSIGSSLFTVPAPVQNFPNFTKLDIKTAAYLDLIAHYRASATEADPFSVAFNQNVLNQYSAGIPDAKKWKFAAAGSGKTFRITVTDGNDIRCVSIGNDYLLGKADFAAGLPRGNTMELQGLAPAASATITDASQFGDWANGACR